VPFYPPVHKPGDAVRADDVNAQNFEIQRLGNISGGPGLVTRQAPGGFQVDLVETERIFIKLTGTATGGAYPWKEVYHATPNTWNDSTRTGTTSSDAAYPLSGDTTLTADGKVWEAVRAATSGVWVFD